VGLVALLAPIGAGLALSEKLLVSSAGAALAVVAPGVAAALAGTLIDGLVGLAPSLAVVALYLVLRAKTAETLIPNVGKLVRQETPKLVYPLLGQRTARHLGLPGSGNPKRTKDATRR
jgi:hypothetical protein